MKKTEKMQEALFYEKQKNDLVKCLLCPWFCELKPGQTGSCKVRENVEGTLVTHVYNKVAALSTDPIEKKPLYHFYPGKNILSIGEVGCNLHCNFCQNHHISQCLATEFYGFHSVTSEQIVNRALSVRNNIGIAYTYNEPFTFYEFMSDIAQLSLENGLRNVVVSNGYINPEPLSRILPYIDAFNIDLKAFDNNFYKKQTKGKLKPVKETLKKIAGSASHLEITNLVITSLNDDESAFEKMVKWIAAELGPEVPLHLSRYFPQYRSTLPPTPQKTLNNLFSIASQHLQYVYLGNVNEGKKSSTFCSSCGTLLIERNGYQTKIISADFDGRCPKCGAPANIVMG
ncbi:AmmeMemoRadiSam system radical SAM enzyme [Mariniphaga sediminis]|uniref:AmmeMemoRadiSam system radical SAM enzyme n=1 Tax=Mariniphaga sediminis TaxID=1628158 RepID=UPI00356613C9